jgi:DNA-binding XRE family transcriptional regulator
MANRRPAPDNGRVSARLDDAGEVSTRRRTSLAVQARRSLQNLLVSEGQKLRRARKRRRWTQVDLARRTGVSPSTISAVERGDGGALSLELWQQVALVLLPLKLEIGRDLMEEPVDAGHLRIQELVRGWVGRRGGGGPSRSQPSRMSQPAQPTSA